MGEGLGRCLAQLHLILGPQLLVILLVDVHLLGGLLHGHWHLVGYIVVHHGRRLIGHHESVQAEAFSWRDGVHLDFHTCCSIARHQGQQLDVVVLVVVGPDALDDLQRLEVRVCDVVDPLSLQPLLGTDQLAYGPLAILQRELPQQRDGGRKRDRQRIWHMVQLPPHCRPLTSLPLQV